MARYQPTNNMKPALVIGLLLAVVATGRADVFSQAKGQAKRAGGQESAPAGTQPQAPQNNQPMDPALAATLANIANLRTDFAALNNSADSIPSADVRLSLLNHLSAAAQGPKPSSATIQKLAGQLGTALLGKKSMTARQATLARYVHALFNGSHLTEAQRQTILDEVKKILAEAGCSVDDSAAILISLHAIVTETK